MDPRFRGDKFWGVDIILLRIDNKFNKSQNHQEQVRDFFVV